LFDSTDASMAFSPSVYGDRAAAALNVMAGLYQWQDKPEDGSSDEKYFTKTQPQGTPFEADLLLSCTSIRSNTVNFIMRITDPGGECFEDDNEYAKHFFADPAQYTAICVSYKKTKKRDARNAISAKVKESILSAVLEFRKSIRDMVAPEEPSETPAFRDSLFGPHVAKVMNSLLVVEVGLTENDTTPPRRLEQGGEHQEIFKSLILKNSLADERRSFALRSGKGTAFAGELLVLQHYRSCGHELEDEKGDTLPLVKDAMFPVFQYNIRMIKSLAYPLNGLSNVRQEMIFLTEVVHGQALPILMAGVHRLGSESLFRDMDKELICIIARHVIFG
jgi:hypothetical protein